MRCQRMAAMRLGLPVRGAPVSPAIGAVLGRGGMVAAPFVDLPDALLALLVFKADLRGRAFARLKFFGRPLYGGARSRGDSARHVSAVASWSVLPA